MFLADVAPPTPIKWLRLKLQLFLSGSPFYSLPTATTRLSALPFLKYELAIVLGRQTKHKAALQLLARDVGDAISAQTYCTQGGEVIPPKVAHSVASHVPELAAWATLGDIGRKRKGTVDAKVQEGLVMDLLGVYMNDATASDKTATLLNAQSLHLDALEVLRLLPPEWPLASVSMFFQRSLRRQMHDQHTWQILKSIAAGQNLATSDSFLEFVRSVPPTIGPVGPGHGRGDDSSPVVSLPDEGSIPGEQGDQSWREKAVFVGEKSDDSEVSGSPEAGGEKRQRGESFFSPEGVVKELADIRSEQGDRQETAS